MPGMLGLCAFQQHHWGFGRHWSHPGNAAYSLLFGSHLCSLLLYYSSGSMESQFLQRASSPTAILGFVTALNLGEQEKLVILGEEFYKRLVLVSFPTRKHCVHLMGSGKSKVSTTHVVAVTGVGTFLFSKPQSFLPVEEARLQPTDMLSSLNSFLLLPCHPSAPIFP